VDLEPHSLMYPLTQVFLRTGHEIQEVGIGSMFS
jgi:hypothetical protein